MSEPEYDDAALTAAVADFRVAAMREINPRGPVAAAHRARQRRRNRTLTLCAALVLLVAVPTAALAQLRQDRREPAVVPSSTTPAPTPTLTPGSSPSPSLTAASPPVRPGAARSSTATKNCKPGNHISIPSVGTPATVEVAALPLLCPGEKVYFFWATYRIQDADTLVLAASGRSYVDHQHVRRTINLPGFQDDAWGCVGAFIVEGRGSIKSTLHWSSTATFGMEPMPYGGNTREQFFPAHSNCPPP